MKVELRSAEREHNHSVSLEIFCDGSRFGVIWKFQDSDPFFSWAVGDGSRHYGLSNSIREAQVFAMSAFSSEVAS